MKEKGKNGGKEEREFLSPPTNLHKLYLTSSELYFFPYL